MRGANRHGGSVHRVRLVRLVRLVRHDAGRVLGQRTGADQSHEITAAPRLLAGRTVRGTGTTMDALLTPRAVTTQMVVPGGQYVLGVTANQPELLAAITPPFAAPPMPESADETDPVPTRATGHGRVAILTRERRAALNDDRTWPAGGRGGAAPARRPCQRVARKTGVIGAEVSSGVTRLTPGAAAAAPVAALWRGPWTSENRIPYVRDVPWGEDAGQVRVGHAPPALAARRTGWRGRRRALAWTPIADATRPYGAFAHRAIPLLAPPPARL